MKIEKLKKEFKEVVCKRLGIEDTKCKQLWNSARRCWEYTRRTKRECAVILDKEGNVIVSKGKRFRVCVPEDIKEPIFMFHTHYGEPYFSQDDMGVCLTYNPKLCCVGGYTRKGDPAFECTELIVCGPEELRE